MPPADTDLKDVWEKEYEWILFQNSKKEWLRQPINHNRIYFSADTNPEGGEYIYGLNSEINPTISLLSDHSIESSKPVELCLWGYDSHFQKNYQNNVNGLEEGVKYHARYKILTTSADKLKQIFQQSIFDPSLITLLQKEAPIYQNAVNDFSISRNLGEPHNEWVWSGNYQWDKTTGFNDNYSIKLERNNDNDLPQHAFIGTIGLSFFTDTKPAPAGAYVISAYFKTENISGASPTISVASKLPAREPQVFTIAAPTTTDGWQKISFVANLPQNTGAEIHLNFNGKGAIWFDNVSLTLKNQDRLTPFIERIYKYIKRHF